MSTNNGTDWVEVNNGLTELNVHALAVSGTNIFAGTGWGGGIFLSSNNGTSWTATNTGLPKSWINKIAISGTNIFTGTEGDGVFLSQTMVQTGLKSTMDCRTDQSRLLMYRGQVYMWEMILDPSFVRITMVIVGLDSI